MVMVIRMELEELRDAMSELSYDDIEFFVHLTERENGHSICENGLYIDDNKLSSCVNPVLDSFYDDPEHYVDFELGNPQTRAKEIMVLIGCERDEESRLIKKNNNGQSEYVIPSENVIGFVDLDSKYFDSNPNSEYSIGMGQNL